LDERETLDFIVFWASLCKWAHLELFQVWGAFCSLAWQPSDAT
jgi:hypothetical protein